MRRDDADATGETPHAADVRPHDSPLVRALLIAAGAVFVGLGIAGAILPVLPATPFFLLAAACFARASERFYTMLVTHPAIGPTILEWRRHRAIPWRTKLWAIALMSSTLAVSTIFFVPDPAVQAGLGVLGVLLALWLWRVPSRDRPPRT